MKDASLRARQVDLVADVENTLETARNDLEMAIADIVSGLGPFGLLDETEDGKRRLNREALADLLGNINGVQRALADAFEDYDWRVRELRALKKAL